MGDDGTSEVAFNLEWREDLDRVWRVFGVVSSIRVIKILGDVWCGNVACVRRDEGKGVFFRFIFIFGVVFVSLRWIGAKKGMGDDGISSIWMEWRVVFVIISN